MKRISFVFSVIFAFSIQTLTAQKVAGFFPDWVAASKLNDVKYDKLTDVFFAFVYPDATGNLLTTTSGSATTILAPLATNVHAAGGKVHVCAGGANSSTNFSAVCANATYRDNFVNSAANYIQTYNLDGFNVDWEFPAGSDAANLALLMQELRTKMDELEVSMGKTLELSMAVAPLLWHTDGINSTSIAVSDYIYVMAFDAQGTCCVCAGDHHSDYQVAVQSLEKWTTGVTDPGATCGDATGKNAPISKLVLAIPFYSSNPYEAYNTFSAGDPATYFNDADGLIGTSDYNSCPMIQQKTDLVMQQGGAGTWTWELSQDRTDQYSLTTCMYDAMSGYACSAPAPDLGSDQSICGQGSITLNTNVNTAAGRTFTWYKDGVVQVSLSTTANTYTVSSAGTYKVDVTEGGCSTSDQIVVTGSIPTPNLGNSQDLCNPASITLDANVDPTGLNFAWQQDGQVVAGATNSALNVSEAGTYTVTVSASGCTSQTDNVSITSSLPTGTNDTICSSGTANLSASTTVEWFSATSGGAALSSGTSYSPSISNSTTYWIQEAGGATQTETTMRSAFQNDGWQQDANVYATKFTALQDLTLNEIQVNAGGGSLTINVVGSNGTTVVASKTFASVTGSTILTLDFQLSAGTYFINAVGSASTLLVDLTPATNYSVTGVITVEGEAYWDWSAPYGDGYVLSGDYGFFTNLKVTTGGTCERVPVYAVIDNNHSSCTSTPPVADFTSDNTTACTSENIVFTNASTGGAGDSYAWNFGSGATPATANTVGPHTVNYSAEGNKTISLTVTNAFGNSTESKTNYITITNTPGDAGTITGDNSVCINATKTYSISSVSGANNYTWTVPSGATINSGQGSTSIDVDFSGANSGNISVTPSNGCGDGGSNSLAITVNSLPDDPGNISGNSSVCAGTSENFSLTAVNGATGYNWTLPSGASITSGNGTNSITVDFTGATSGDLTVIPSNACGSGNSATLAITVNDIPTGVGNIVGDANICPNEANVIYSATSFTDATTYTWTVPNGAVITSGQGSSDIHVDFGAAAGIVSVTASNTCGDGNTASLTVSSDGATLPIIEGFETGIPTDWSIENGDGTITWEQANVGANGTSNNSLFINFKNYTTIGQEDNFTSQVIDLTGTVNNQVTFDHAYSWYDIGGSKNDKFDSLIVKVSTDCGATFTEVFRKGGADLTTSGGGQQAAFTPTSGQWVNNVIDLSAYDGQPSLIVQFVGVNQNGNNLYIDNINITGTTLAAPEADFAADDTTVCAGNTIVFSDNSINSPTSWSWDFGAGATPSTATGAGPHQVTYSTGGFKILELTVSNSMGNSTKTRTNYIEVDTLPEAVGTVNGASSVCKSTPENYSVSAVAGADSYAWTVPSGAVINSGQGSTSIEVDFSNASSGNVTVTPSNGCGTGSTKTIAVQVKDLPADPSTIAGPYSVCENETGVEFSISEITTATSYSWSVPTGASIIGTSDTNVVVVNFGTTAGDVSVNATNSCGTTATQILAVSITNGANDAGTITGDASVCENANGVTFSIASVTGASGYTWTVPTGAAIASGNNTNSITVNFGSASGDITVAPTSSCGDGASSTLGVTINLLPDAAGTISGTSTVCNGDVVTYTLPDVTGATGYTWTVPTGASIVNGQGTTSLEVDFTGATSGDVSVVPNNSCGDGASSALGITVNDVPSIPGVITGNTTLCENVTGETYAIAAVNGATSYTWVVPTGASIVNGQGTEQITVNFGTTSGDVYVHASNTCGSSVDSSVIAVSITNGADDAGAITGTATLCENTTGETYSIDAVIGATGYTWTVPTGASIVSGQGTEQIIVNFGSNSGNIIVTPTSSCGDGAAKTLGITINTYPETPTTLNGSLGVCLGSSEAYNIDPITNATTYNWTVPIGASITNGLGTNSITVDFTNATSGNITVKAANGGCVGANLTEAIMVNDIPANPSAINGNNSVCVPANNQSYSISAVSGADDYSWFYTGTGATINGANESVTIDFANNATSGNLYVKANNSCGSSDSVVAVITLSNSPSAAGTISGTAAVCNGDVVIYTLSNVTNATGYTWSVPSGASILNGQGTTSLEVDFTGATSGDVSAVPNNSCGDGASSALGITVNDVPSTPGVITGNTTLCENVTGETYAIAAVNGATSYTWSIPTGASITSGQGTEQITVDFGITSGDVYVKASNACGLSSDSALVPVSITNGSEDAGVITGSTSVCENTIGATYSIATVLGATSYTWTVPTGTSVVNGQGTEQITVNFGSNSGDITVTPNSSCGDGANANISLTVNSIPSKPAISGEEYVGCDVIEEYAVLGSGNSYNWVSHRGSIIQNGNSNVNIDYTGVLGPDTITVSAISNGCSSEKDTLGINVCDVITSTLDLAQKNLLVYPNPSNSNFVWGSETAAINVYNHLGELVYHNKANSGTTFGDDFAPGIYFLKANDQTLKLIKIR